jgi:hypothetical protein
MESGLAAKSTKTEKEAARQHGWEAHELGVFFVLFVAMP